MLSFSNAKINLGLNIIEKRPDGYHNIESAFYPIPWADVIEILPNSNFEFVSTGLEIPGDFSQNLIVKAFNLLKENHLLSQNVKIHLHKILPMGAGIGGGSSNGAFTLKMLNDIFNLNISKEKLESLAEKLGSDCPFFIDNKPKFCYEKGTKFEEITLNLAGKYLIMVNPQIHISTQEAYAGIKPSKPLISIKEIIKKPISDWKNELVNDFEAPILEKYPAIEKIKEDLYKNGALYASMTGSGSTVFGIFEHEVDLKKNFETYIYWSGKMV